MLRLVAIAIGLAAVVPTVCAQEVNQPKNAWEPAEMVVGPLPLERFAERLPAYALLRTIPGVGPTVGAILLAEIGDIGWYTKFSQLRKLAGLDIIRVQSGQFAGQARISKCGRSLLRWALYHAAMGLARTTAGRARLAALKVKRQGDRYAGFKEIVELAATVFRLVWGVWRSGRIS